MRPFMPCSRLSAVSPPLASFPASPVILTAQLAPQFFRQTPPPTFSRQIRVLNHLPSAQVHKRAISRRLVARSGAQSASNGEADRGDDSREPFQSGGGDGGAGGESGSSESEARRLALDDAARAEMRARSELALAAMAEGSRGAAAAVGDAPGNAAGDTGGSGGSGDGGAWKWAVRKGVWDELEARDVARPPRPVHHRIPNFDGADKAAAMLASLPEFQAAGCVKVNPDTPQKAVRLAALQVHKRAISRRLVARSGAQSASNGEADRGDDSREPFQSGGGDGGAGGESGSSESEARRLALDDAARAEMRARSELALAAMAEGSRGAAAAVGDAPGNAAGDTGGSGGSGDGGAWKWAVRKGVWDELEARDVARPPRPVHHRIPNFDGADKAAAMLASLPEFQAAGCVKVNPDTPQKAVRLAALQGNKLLLTPQPRLRTGNKLLLTPQPRLRTGFFSRLSADHIPPDQLLAACTAAGVARHGVPVALEDKVAVDMVVLGSVAVDPTTGARLGKGECSTQVAVDMVVLGSVAVDPTTGARLGKGEGFAELEYGILRWMGAGFAELEYGILRWMGAVTDDTPVVTTVHDCQLVAAGAIPTSNLRQHDLPVDIICTPTQIIRVSSRIPKPSVSFSSPCKCHSPLLASVILILLSLQVSFSSPCKCHSPLLASVILLSLQVSFSSPCKCHSPLLASVILLSLQVSFSSPCKCHSPLLASVILLSLQVSFSSPCKCHSPLLASVILLSLQVSFSSPCKCHSPLLASGIFSPPKTCLSIYWHLLSPQKLAQIRILQQLKSTLEAQTGAALPLGPDEELPPVAARHGKGGRRKEGGRGGGKVGERGGVGRGRGERRGGEGRRSERKVWRRGDDRGSGGEEGGRE
ncbi:unnamed protein product [Closterium sp. NIES-65]|nr:unnamed protein product [Closterium sp. NIES-65]